MSAKYKTGDRVYVKKCGAGTVTAGTYNRRIDAGGGTLTPVQFDDYLGQVLPLAVETELLQPLVTVHVNPAIQCVVDSRVPLGELHFYAGGELVGKLTNMDVCTDGMTANFLTHPWLKEPE